MHTLQLLAVLLASVSVHAISLHSLGGLLGRRQDPAALLFPRAATVLPAPAIVPTPDPAAIQPAAEPAPAPAVISPAAMPSADPAAVQPATAPAPDPAAISPPSVPAPSVPDPTAAAAPDGVIGIQPIPAGGADTGKNPGDPLKGGKGQCPPIWKKISRELTSMFTENGQCNDLARGAIRAAFHDCGAYKLSLGNNAGCDGSLFLAPEEITRQENSGLVDIIPKLGALAQQYGVGMADFFQFAAGKYFKNVHRITDSDYAPAHAIKTCPMGPTVQTFVGRKDSRKANPEGLIPNPRAPGESLVQLFQDKGISPTELTALIGAHTTSKQFVFDPAKAGTPLDSTVGVWDVKFYQQVLKKDAPFILPSDMQLSQTKQTGAAFKAFAKSQGEWSATFSPA
jgi:manganese peroxidase